MLSIEAIEKFIITDDYKISFGINSIGKFETRQEKIVII